MKQCPACDARSFKQGRKNARRTVDGVSFEGTLPATICRKCSESYVDASALERFELVIADALAKLGHCTPAAFTFMRKTLGLSGIALAELLGTTPETISRWEHGARGLDRGAFALVAGIVAERIEGRDDTRARLNALRKPAKRGRRVIRVESLQQAGIAGLQRGP